MPLGIKSDYSLVGDGLGATLATVSVLGQIAFLAEGSSLDVHELGSDQLAFASAANEMVFVPVGTHGLNAFLC